MINHDLTQADKISLYLLAGSAILMLIIALVDDWKTRHPHQ